MAHNRFARLRRPLLVLVGIAAMVLLLAWLMGAFHRRVPPGDGEARHGIPATGERWTVQVTKVPRTASAVGTIRASQQTIVATRILGRIETLAIERAGQPVKQGDVLVTIESSDLKAMADAARAALQVAETRREKARVDLERTKELFQKQVAAKDRLDSDQASFDAAVAEVERARQSVGAADSALGFATVRAPITGIVVDKQVQVGDIVQPGQPICTLYDPTRLQLVATVREELAGRLQVGQAVDVTLDALGKECQGTVSEIVPTAQTQSRAFEVKVTGPCQPGIVTGMFGRLHVPLDDVEELRVPERAVHSIGQLDFVHVLAGDTAERRFVHAGRRALGQVQILSGLAAGEVVLVDQQPR